MCLFWTVSWTTIPLHRGELLFNLYSLMSWLKLFSFVSAVGFRWAHLWVGAPHTLHSPYLLAHTHTHAICIPVLSPQTLTCILWVTWICRLCLECSVVSGKKIEKLSQLMKGSVTTEWGKLSNVYGTYYYVNNFQIYLTSLSASRCLSFPSQIDIRRLGK